MEEYDHLKNEISKLKEKYKKDIQNASSLSDINIIKLINNTFLDKVKHAHNEYFTFIQEFLNEEVDRLKDNMEEYSDNMKDIIEHI